METKIILYGASGHAKVIIDIFNKNKKTIDAIIDDNPKNDTILGIKVLKTSKFDFKNFDNALLSIGNNSVRKALSNKYKISYVNAIHPTAIISSNIEIGVGNAIMAGSIINPDVKIGSHCIINTGAILEHDCIIDDFAHISPGVLLAGNVSVGEGSHIGIGAIVIQSIKIGKWATIGAGAVVINDIPDFAVVVGNPGKIIKYKEI